MGADYIDYMIADKIVVPKSHQQHYSEKIVYLPHSYQANDFKRAISEKVFRREEMGLKENSFVFCCFNNGFKILPETFDSWARILKQVDGSVLWLLESSVTNAENLRKEARHRGLDSERLVFAPPMSPPDHLARHRCADLFLDTLPYNAHTTASDALWACLPVLTQIGETFAGRVAASLLTAIGLTELITSTPKAYEDLAIELATSPEKLVTIKRKLAEIVWQCPFSIPNLLHGTSKKLSRLSTSAVRKVYHLNTPTLRSKSSTAFRLNEAGAAYPSGRQIECLAMSGNLMSCRAVGLRYFRR